MYRTTCACSSCVVIEHCTLLQVMGIHLYICMYMYMCIYTYMCIYNAMYICSLRALVGMCRCANVKYDCHRHVHTYM